MEKERKETCAWRPIRVEVPQVLLHSSIPIFGENDQHEEKTYDRKRLKKIIQILRKKAQVDPSLDIPRSANNQ